MPYKKQALFKIFAPMATPLRISIIGTSGVGKTTLGQRLQSRFGLDHIEIDNLYWGPEWTPRDNSEVQANLMRRVSGDNWATTGNYKMYQPIILDRATHVVWLDYPWWVIGPQLLRRTFQRSWTRESLFGGCQESWRMSFASKDSILLWAATTYRSNKERYRELFASDQYPQAERVQLGSRKQTEAWLSTLDQPDTNASSTG